MLPPLMLAISVHEAAHAYVAYRKGDYTAKLLGRVTLNPVKHIDPVGTILVPIMMAISHIPFLIGWAKPVPVNSFNFKSPRKDNMLVSFAGPASNLLLALILALLFRILIIFPGEDVMIEYIGQRPGEKLFEELFHEKEQLESTTHNKVLLARHRKVNWEVLQRAMLEIQSACEAMDNDKLNDLLLQLVPELDRNTERKAVTEKTESKVVYLKS